MQHKYIVAIIVISLIIGSCTLTRGHEWGDDFASYILQAQSIWNGETNEFVERNSFTILESSHQIGPIAYPWGYPLVLAPVYALKGRSPLPLKVPGLVFFAGFLISLYFLAKNRFSRAESLLFVSLFAFNPVLIKFLDQILSDIPFLFFSTTGLFFMSHGRKRGTLDYAILGVVLSCAFFVRTTGILLLASFILAESLKIYTERNNQARGKITVQNTALSCGIFSFLWILYAAGFPGGSESYFAQLQGLRVETIPGQVQVQLWLFSLFFGNTGIWIYVYYVFFVFFLIGFWAGKNTNPVFIVFFTLWMAVIVIWPFWQGLRLIFPLIPIFIYFSFEGMILVIHKLPLRYNWMGKAVFHISITCIIGIFLTTSAINAYHNLVSNRQINGPYDIYSIGVYDFIKNKTPEDSIVVFFKPRAMRLMTGHDSVLLTECSRLALGDYIVLSRKADNSQIPPEQIDSCTLPLDQVFDNRRFIIYHILK